MNINADSKYEFVAGDSKVIAPGRVVKRIRALVAIASFNVSPGDLGGYIEAKKNLQVSGNAWVSGDARVCGNARVSGDAQVCGNASFLMIGPIGSRRAMLNIYADAKIGVRFSTGCFTGSREQFFAAVTDTHGDSEHGNAYAVALMLADVLVKPCEIEQLAEAA